MPLAIRDGDFADCRNFARNRGQGKHSAQDREYSAITYTTKRYVLIIGFRSRFSFDPAWPN